MSDIKNENQAPKPGTKEALQQQLAAAGEENANLAAQVNELKAQLEAQKKPENAVTAAAPASDREKIFIPRPSHSNDEQNLIVGLNGKTYVLPKGQESEVPAEVAAEIRRSWRAAERYDKTRERKLEEAAQAEAQLKQLIG